MMVRRYLYRSALLGVMLVPVTLSGCATNTGTGALAGGGLGAAAGALIGSATGHAGKGALIGGAIGAATGGLVGAAKDEENRQVAAAAARNAMSVQEVMDMARNGVSDGVICKEIVTSGTVFQLTPADVTNLHNQGVSERVINTMLETRRRPVVVRPGPVYVEPAPVVIVEPAPPPPAFGFGVSYHSHR